MKMQYTNAGAGTTPLFVLLVVVPFIKYSIAGIISFFKPYMLFGFEFHSTIILLTSA